jgi:hypothetical protein
MISPSFARNTVRGFWPGLGAKSWASAGMGRQPGSLLLTGRDPGLSQTLQVNLGRICWMDVGLLGLRPMALVGLRELSQKRSEISPTIRPRILGSSASNDNVGEPRFVGVGSSNEFVHDRTRQRRAILPRYGEHRLSEAR